VIGTAAFSAASWIAFAARFWSLVSRSVLPNSVPSQVFVTGSS